jgi:hypothetical protein
MHNGLLGPLSDAANPLSCLAEMFSNYFEFQPQNLMIKYVNDPATGLPKKKNPWEPSHDDWAELSLQTYDVDPTNISRKNILRDEVWIKSTWNDVRKYLHQVFIQYNRSRQHSGDMGEWCSPEEQQRWFELHFGGEAVPIILFAFRLIRFTPSQY